MLLLMEMPMSTSRTEHLSGREGLRVACEFPTHSEGGKGEDKLGRVSVDTKKCKSVHSHDTATLNIMLTNYNNCKADVKHT